ncbi:hypothetical protein F383_00035 [Gossypium arboreum]|uniref:Uncharacterized protein n=1 Tax=Gossypium arboreum TaxID=29729 RepID=A0A0B0PE37_GOSAR|nr:hypothetical protein F383_00035 [Gossypium arboreum]
MLLNPKEWPFQNRPRIGLDRDTPVWHACVGWLRPCFESAK